jgi:glycosyltransferase involved in cell wall biosynthesis
MAQKPVHRESIRAGEDARHIAAIVINSVSHDARVLKEADGLAAAGYRVTIYGIQDAKVSEPVTVRPSGVVIRRAEWKSGVAIARGRIYFALAILIALVAVGELLLVITGRAGAPYFGYAFVLLAMPLTLLLARRVWDRGVAIQKSALQAPIRPAPAAAMVEPKPSATAIGSGQNTSAPNAPKSPSVTARSAKKPARRDNWLDRRLAPWRSRHAARLRRRALLQLVLADRPDAVHAHDLQAVPIALAVKRAIGCPLIFDSHELHDDLSLISEAERERSRRKHRSFAPHIDGLVTVNESIGRTLRERYPALPEPVIVRNATRYTGERMLDDGRLHRAAGLARSTRILLYQGGFARHRGLDVLVRAAPLLPEGWALVMMGWGNFEPELRRIAAEVDPAGERVRFVPGAPQEELGQWTAGGSLGVIPYENVCLNHWFCTPNKIWEYPVAGVPILASPFPELAKAVEENGIGLLLADPVTPANIAAVVASVGDDDLERMRERCGAFLARDNWSIYERRLIELYARVLGGASRSAATGPTAAPSIPMSVAASADR